MPATPEQQAREEIDRQLEACGWIVQDHKAMNIMAGPGVAVREFPLKTGFADYLLYVEGKVIRDKEEQFEKLRVNRSPADCRFIG